MAEETDCRGPACGVKPYAGPRQTIPSGGYLSQFMRFPNAVPRDPAIEDLMEVDMKRRLGRGAAVET